MAGKCCHAGAAAGATETLIGADRINSPLITISQLFTWLHLWQLRKVECVRNHSVSVARQTSREGF